jgi:hypothetical protein
MIQGRGQDEALNKRLAEETIASAEVAKGGATRLCFVSTTVCVPAAQVKLNCGVHGPDLQSSYGASASRWSCASWTQARASAAASEDILSYKL